MWYHVVPEWYVREQQWIPVVLMRSTVHSEDVPQRDAPVGRRRGERRSKLGLAAVPPRRCAARRSMRIDRLRADAGYDAEHNHELAREELGVRSTVINLNPRRAGKKWPSSKYRRQMRCRFCRKV